LNCEDLLKQKIESYKTDVFYSHVKGYLQKMNTLVNDDTYFMVTYSQTKVSSFSLIKSLNLL